MSVGMQTGADTVENSIEFPQSIKNGIAFDPAILPLGIYPKNPEMPIQKNLCMLMFIAVLFTIVKIWKRHKCPSVDEWIKKQVYLHNGMLCCRKKKEFLPFAKTWLELETIMLSEVSHSVKDKSMISLI